MVVQPELSRYSLGSKSNYHSITSDDQNFQQVTGFFNLIVHQRSGVFSFKIKKAVSATDKCHRFP